MNNTIPEIEKLNDGDRVILESVGGVQEYIVRKEDSVTGPGFRAVRLEPVPHHQATITFGDGRQTHKL